MLNKSHLLLNSGLLDFRIGESDPFAFSFISESFVKSHNDAIEEPFSDQFLKDPVSLNVKNILIIFNNKGAFPL